MTRSSRILVMPGAHSSPAARFRMIELIGPLRSAGYEVEGRIPTPDRVGKNRSGETATVTRFSRRVAQVFRLMAVMRALRDADQFDVVFANRDLVPEPKISMPEKSLFRRGIPLVFDFDDAIHLGTRREKVSKILKNAAWVTPGNPFLAEFARKHSQDLTVLPTVVNTDVYLPRTAREPGPVRIGWSGSASTNKHCLPILEHPIREVSRLLDIEFIVISNEDPKLEWAGVRSRFIPWNAGSEVRDLQLLDVGTMPLEDSEFERGKCGLKAIQYMAVGVPAVVSPVGVNREIVTDGKNGFHAFTAKDWVERLTHLAQDENLRARLGEAARSTVEERYSHRVAVDILTGIFSKITEMRSAQRGPKT